MAALPDKDKLLRNFSRCANWEEKYLYIIELGQRLAPLSPEEHSVQNIIQGCQSQVQCLPGNWAWHDDRQRADCGGVYPL